jgi:succinate-semialdehyde dehydrogenase/glutarate-semialdehyde dehydrogenase/aspartate-semialdehyde dehydrogenase
VNSTAEARARSVESDIERAALARLRRRRLVLESAFVAGQWIDDGVRITVRSPATGYPVGTVPHVPSGVIDSAIAAAGEALPVWQRRLSRERGRVLQDWAVLLREQVDDLATLITLEQGKPLAESRHEVGYAASYLDWFAAEGCRSYGDAIPAYRPGQRAYVVRQPIGVVGVITPWNFPLAMLARKAAAALAAGCTVVARPDSRTPFSALAFAALGQRCGLDLGALSVVTADAVTFARELCASDAVRALSFTGSTHVGQLLFEQSARTMKRLSLELGGHAPFLVFEDADLDLAIEGCISAKFATGGQDCLAANRILVQRGAYAAFVGRFAQRVSQLNVGHGLEAGTDIGPLMSADLLAKCERHVADATARGARIVAGGARTSAGGNHFAPTVLADVPDSALIWNEETFGPLAPVASFVSEEEALQRANRNRYGLAGYVYTSSLDRALRASERLECGMVGVNAAQFTGAPIPFGGWKHSGLGREGSRYGLDPFMELKFVSFAAPALA